MEQQSNSMKMLITFDVESDLGSWTTNYTSLSKGLPEILEMLDETKIKATFFVTGKAGEHAPDMLRAVHERGHEIGCKCQAVFSRVG